MTSPDRREVLSAQVSTTGVLAPSKVRQKAAWGGINMRAASVLLLYLACCTVSWAEEGDDADEEGALFTVDVRIDDTPITVAVHEGDVIADVARRVGKEHGLARDGVITLQQTITRKATEVLGSRSVKTEFFELPVTVETASGEQHVVVLTVYEESDPARLSTIFAEKYGLPAASASKLQLEVVRQMERRTKVRVEVNLPDGATRLLTVKTDETTKSAAVRFGLEHGLTAQGIDALWAHLDRQVQLKAEAAAQAP